MRDRLSLHEELCTILGSRCVYFQKPSERKMQYPCIVYRKQRKAPVYADGKKYLFSQSYLVTVIYIDPDDDLPDRVLNGFNYISQDTDPYIMEGLYHIVFTLYY